MLCFRHDITTFLADNRTILFLSQPDGSDHALILPLLTVIGPVREVGFMVCEKGHAVRLLRLFTKPVSLHCAFLQILFERHVLMMVFIQVICGLVLSALRNYRQTVTNSTDPLIFSSNGHTNTA